MHVYYMYMPNVGCILCENQFYAKPRDLKKGWGKYCSKDCQYKGQHTGEWKNCDTCTNKVYRTQRELKSSRSEKFFCNKSCLAIWKNTHSVKGEHHPNWKFGEAAYRDIMLRYKKNPVCKGCGISNLRVLIVHHIDQNRKNNTIKNLKWLCRNCHYLEHKGKTF